MNQTSFFMIPSQPVDLSEETLNRTAAMAKVLGHPVRIAILKILAGRQTCYCGDITEVIPLAQSTVSQHLKALKTAGLITGEVEGVRTCYCLSREGVAELKRLTEILFGELAAAGAVNGSCEG
jgi:DNA-binding transcriptional ArsR family regulator